MAVARKRSFADGGVGVVPPPPPPPDSPGGIFPSWQSCPSSGLLTESLIGIGAAGHSNAYAWDNTFYDYGPFTSRSGVPHNLNPELFTKFVLGGRIWHSDSVLTKTLSSPRTVGFGELGQASALIGPGVTASGVSIPDNWDADALDEPDIPWWYQNLTIQSVANNLTCRLISGARITFYTDYSLASPPNASDNCLIWSSAAPQLEGTTLAVDSGGAFNGFYRARFRMFIQTKFRNPLRLPAAFMADFTLT